MTCEEYRSGLNRSLDTGTPGSDSGAMLEHARTCKECREYTSAMLALHRELLSLPREQPSAELLQKILSGREAPAAVWRPAWVPQIVRAVLLLGPLVLIAVLRPFLPVWVDLLQYCLVTVSLSWAFTNILKPFFFAGSEADL